MATEWILVEMLTIEEKYRKTVAAHMADAVVICHMAGIHDTLALCRLVEMPDVAPVVPNDILATLHEALDDSRLYTDALERVGDSEKAEWRKKIDAALAWVESLEVKKVSDGN